MGQALQPRPAALSGVQHVITCFAAEDPHLPRRWLDDVQWLMLMLIEEGKRRTEANGELDLIDLDCVEIALADRMQGVLRDEGAIVHQRHLIKSSRGSCRPCCAQIEIIQQHQRRVGGRAAEVFRRAPRPTFSVVWV